MVCGICGHAFRRATAIGSDFIRRPVASFCFQRTVTRHQLTDNIVGIEGAENGAEVCAREMNFEAVEGSIWQLLISGMGL
jgi:hypothetical protein